MNRYQRQQMLPEIGEAGQQRLRAARVLVVGAGGLGSTLLPLLAGAGVGYLRIWDDDAVELHNLHRQTLFTTADVGQPKALCAARALNERNRDCVTEARQQALRASTVARALEGIDLAIDAADSFAVTYTLSDACQPRHIPLISASVLGRQGYVGGFCGSAPGYRALFPQLPTSAANCNTAGVMGPAVATLGAMQAQMALSVLLGLTPSPLGSLVNCDFTQWHFRAFRFDDAQEPTQPLIPFIDRDLLQADDCIVELRSREEAPHSVAAQVERILPEAIDAWQPPAGRRVVLVCASGIRAAKAASVLAQRGVMPLAIIAANQG
ncbi:MULTISPECIES: HesA/MoeB/ThiF family protein [Pantoea]|jgi:molybdopterin/thiamine biosynthesis adenylyltransferase/rhodanese-related sulfurtransferase|uniref:HesA/MoeB/ThiF family protein n=1 Tax=Pantoea TaxID=53335 RepID=UPI000EA3A033|nr:MULTISPECIES: HesA/MoeB/ThiF family protein [Pantoea]MBZ6386250.1 HesA/MoeB/ThiF family protein [Pantoea piersonii]MBZ6401405.1 HesA/MoeB/ThiF family protein [Pantoea piersonii]MBZ6409775.1 HesA/MoeB/ThiF family protein [Pantoea piersonii]MBZ6428081.1 HesA/MoeB/ThiF family protein [Pantoea piersonii]NYB04391.1 ThiF family adenylyltransferase [Pantoea piersonii]